MGNSYNALGLTQDHTLRDQIENLLPDYKLHWDVLTVPQAADLRPAFLLVDIEDQATPWRDVVVAFHSSPATRRIPMLATAQNPTPDLMQDAGKVSLNTLISTQDLPSRLVDWVARHGRIWDADYYQALADVCGQPLPESAQKGIELFNQHEFWEAHEVLEGAWMEVRPHPIGEVYRSILQIGVAYYQIQRGNYNGAIKMFLRAVQWLDPLPDQCQGINLAQFKQDAAASRAELERLGRDHISEFDPKLFKPVPLI